jgi:hypothetical protein
MGKKIWIREPMMCKYTNNVNVWTIINKGNFVSTLETLTKRMSTSFPIVIFLSQNIN